MQEKSQGEGCASFGPSGGAGAVLGLPDKARQRDGRRSGGLSLQGRVRKKTNKITKHNTKKKLMNQNSNNIRGG